MSLRDQIREFIKRELLMDAEETSIDDATPLLEQSLIDSLGVFSLAAFIEKEFGVQIEDREMVPDHFGSVDSLARLVEAKRADH